MNNECNCGSGEFSYPIFDGYGIYLCEVCHKCEEKELSKYRKDIFECYDCDEPIDSD